MRSGCSGLVTSLVISSRSGLSRSSHSKPNSRGLVNVKGLLKNSGAVNRRALVRRIARAVSVVAYLKSLLIISGTTPIRFLNRLSVRDDQSCKWAGRRLHVKAAAPFNVTKWHRRRLFVTPRKGLHKIPFLYTIKYILMFK